MPKHIAFFVFDGFQILDFSGVSAVFECANLCSGKQLYTWDLLSTLGGLVSASNQLAIKTDSVFDKPNVSYEQSFIVGGDREGLEAAVNNEKTLLAVKDLCNRTALKCSVCSGAFFLAVIGLLDNRMATTHWVALDELKTRFPRLKVQDDVLYVIDQDTATSAGVATGIDLALELLSKDYGRQLANQVAKRLVVSMHRPGSAIQQAPILQQSTVDERFDSLLRYLQNNLNKVIEVEEMANMMNMSQRNFARKFKATYKQSPAQFFIQMKLSHAKMMLSRGYQPEKVASATGYTNVQSLNRLFEKQYGLSMFQFRKGS